MKIQSPVYKFLPLYSFCAFLAFFNPVKAQETSSGAVQEEVLLRQADSLYAQQRYTQAYQQYETVLESGQASPGMLLRMAYIQESLGNISSALYLLNLYYQQTADKEVLTKIEDLAASKNLAGYEYSDLDYFRGSLEQHRPMVLMGLMLLSGAFFLLIVYRRFRQHERPVWLGMVLVLLLGGIFYFVNTPLIPERAIIIQEGAPLMSGPSGGSSLIRQINKGHRLKVLGKEDVWYRVEWENRELYIKETAVTRV